MDQDNEIMGCSSLARNISEQKLADMALKESETKFREIINQINDIIIVFDEEGKIIIWNKGAEQLCGLKADEILNRSIIDVQTQLTPPPNNDREQIENVIKGIITLKTPEIFNQIIDSEIITQNSMEPKNIQSMVFPIELSGYHLFCTVIRDVTEIKRYEKELLKISADKDKFYSVIAQYLYTPFSLFYNFAKLMSAELDTLSVKEIQKMTVMMSKSATNLYSLLDNLLHWTKMNQGKITYEPQKLNLKKISHDAISILKPNAEEKNVRINYVISDEIVVLADIFMIKTVLRNLVANSVKMTNCNGQVDITAQQADSKVTISVIENGPEATPDFLKKLFNTSDIYKALGSAEEKGTTLGLLLCREFVEKHGGKIWVESKNGKGSEIKFTLPSIF
jgi:PAS domain S-box-containing protein